MVEHGGFIQVELRLNPTTSIASFRATGRHGRTGNGREATMKPRIAGLAMTALVTGGLGLTGLGAGIAHAEHWCEPPAMVNGVCWGPNQWCPGDTILRLTQNHVVDPVNWDMTVCHTYYLVPKGEGNVTTTVFEGADPPPPGVLPPPLPYQPPPPGMCWAMWIPAPCPNG